MKPDTMHSSAKIYLAGHRGMVGSAIHRNLIREGFNNVIVRTSKELDLRNQAQVNAFFQREQPEYVIIAAAKVGGINANNLYKGTFIYDNLMIQNNLIHNSYLHEVKKLLFLGSACIYPKLTPQPIKEEYLLTGLLEPTNEPYAIAKIAGIKMCQAYRSQYGCNFISAMPTNLYGQNDNYDLENSHVLPALLRKFITAKQNGTPSVPIWGTGKPRREFLHADDLADACLFLMKNYDEAEIINVGTGVDISILELAQMIQQVVGYDGTIVLDKTKPDGTPKRLMDVSRLKAMGWQASIDLESGIKRVYEGIKDKDWQELEMRTSLV